MLKPTCDRAYRNYVFGQEIMSSVSETVGNLHTTWSKSKLVLDILLPGPKNMKTAT